MMSASRFPIGIMDSGWGGLSVWRSIHTLLPYESTVYIADHAHVPYGGRSTRWIKERTKKLIAYLLSQGAKLVVVACNTATIAGIDAYRKQFPGVPIVGVVPVVKTASEMTRTRKIAIFSTPYTARSRYQKDLIKRFAKGCVVSTQTSSKLVPLIEKGMHNGAAVREELTRMVSRAHRDVDVIALGCTHYPFVARELAAIIKGRDVAILDSGGAVARQIRRVLRANNARATKRRAVYKFYTTGDPATTGEVARLLLRRPILVKHAKL